MSKTPTIHYYVFARICIIVATESHKENSQPDVRHVEDADSATPASVQHQQVGGTPTTSQSTKADIINPQDAGRALPVKRPSIFASVSLLAESSSSSTSSRGGHRVSSPFGVASNVDAPAPFVTPPYTPRSRSHLTGQHHPATPLAAASSLHQQQDPNASLMTPPGTVITPDNRVQRHQITGYTPPFTPVRPLSTTPVHLGRPRSRLSLNSPSTSLHDLTRPPPTATAGSLALVSRLNL